MRALLVAVGGLLSVPAAAADDFALLRARDRYLPPAQAFFAETPDGYQARYDAGRNLAEALVAAGPSSRPCAPLRAQLAAFALAQVRIAEAADHPVRKPPPPLPRVRASCRPASRLGAAREWRNPRLPLPRCTRVARPARADPALAARLGELGRGYGGWAGLWVHDLRSGRAAGWNADARFPAASTVKLGVVLAAVARARRPEATRDWYDVRRIGAWSSNLAANRLLRALGPAAVARGLERLGMTASTNPGPYRATTALLDAPKPPPHGHRRVTTAADLGRALYRIHAAAIGNRLALRRTGLTQHQASLVLSVLLAPERAGANLGLLRPWLGTTLVAEKNGWLSDSRITAALVYRRGAPVIVVVAAWAPRLDPRTARALGRDVLRVLPR